MGGLVAQPHGLLGRAVRGHGLVGEQTQRLQPGVRRQQPVARLVDPDEPDPALAVLQRHDQPVARPRVRPAPVELGLVGHLVDADPGRRHLAGQQIAPRDLELVREQRAQRLDGRAAVHRRPVECPTGGRHRDERPVAAVGQLDHHLVEAEGVLDPVAYRLQHRVDIVGLGKARRHLEHALEHPLVLDVIRRVLGDLEGERRMPRDRHERLQLGVGGAATGHGLVHRDHPEDVRAAVPQRDEQRIAREPGVRILALRQLGHVRLDPERVPVELPVGQEVGAAALEAGREERCPGVVGGGRAEQRLARLLRAHRGGGEHVVERRPVHVDHHGAVAEHLGDRTGHVLQDRLEVALVTDRRGALEGRSQPGEHRRACQPPPAPLRLVLRGTILSCSERISRQMRAASGFTSGQAGAGRPRAQPWP